MRLDTGRMHHRLTLQKKVESRTSSGSVAITWTTSSTVWGAIEPLSGREYLAASQTQNETDVRIMIRYHSTIDETWRILNNNIAYSIKSVVNHDMINEIMTIMCSKGVKEEVTSP